MRKSKKLPAFTPYGNKYLSYILLIFIILLNGQSVNANQLVLFENSKIQSSSQIGTYTLTPSQPINISSNQQLLNLQRTYGWTGDGSASSPIIIEHLIFQNLGLTDYFVAFNISNTDLNFIFRDNVINISSVANTFRQYCIFAKNVINGQFIENNVTNVQNSNSLQYHSTGISIINSNNIVLSGNVLTNFFYALTISNSNVNVKNNYFLTSYIGTTFTNTDTALPWNILFQNNVYYGNNYGLQLFGTELYKIYYNISLEKNIFIENAYGLNIVAYETAITDNYFANNSNYALQLTRASGTNISFNLFDHNGFGIKINRPPYNLSSTNCFTNSRIPECKESGSNFHLHLSNIEILKNVIANQTDYGLYIDSSCDNNSVVGNNFINNTIQAYQLSNTTWNNQVLGNYWSDYTEKNNKNGIGDTPYLINIGGIDEKPLIEEQKFIINNSWLPQYKYVPRNVFDSAIYYSIIIIPLLGFSLIIIVSAVVWKYKKYESSVKGNKRKLSFIKYFTKQIKPKPKEKLGMIHADRALEMLEEIMDETSKGNDNN